MVGEGLVPAGEGFPVVPEGFGGSRGGFLVACEAVRGR